MTKFEYLAELQQHLQGLNSQARTEILREIESHIQESGCRDDELLDRFGPPAELAGQYLDDGTELPVSSPAKSQFRPGKTLLLVLGGSLLTIITAVVFAYWMLAADQFDYSDTDAPELKDGYGSWNQQAMPEAIEIRARQSKVLVYWYDKDEISWSCDTGATPEFSAGTAEIKQNQCYLYLPARPATIHASQSQLVAIKPPTQVKFSLYQSTLRIAEPVEGYHYSVNNNDSWIEALNNNPDAAIQIEIDADQSTAKLY